jgi:hypothetical protein
MTTQTANCEQVQALLSSYVDGAVSGAEMRAVSDHLRECIDCRAQHAQLERMREMLSALGRKAAPPELALKIQIAVLHQQGMTFKRRMQGLLVRTENAVNAFMLPATGGLVAALIIFGLFVGFFAVPRVSAHDDVPTTLYIPPRLIAAPDPALVGTANNGGKPVGPVIIEAFVDSQGRLQDYNIIYGEDNKEVRRVLDRSLIFTTFEPAISFGERAPGRVVMSFATFNVKG